MTVERDELSEQVRATRSGSAGWHIQRLAGQLDRAMNRALEPHGLTVQSFAIVMTLVEHDGLSQTQIGERFSAPAYAISRAIDGLESDGFLERRTDPNSRRSNTVHATGKAKALVPDLISIIDRVNGGLMAGLLPAERSHMIALLSKVLADNSLADV